MKTMPVETECNGYVPNELIHVKWGYDTNTVHKQYASTNTNVDAIILNVVKEKKINKRKYKKFQCYIEIYKQNIGE